MVEPERTHKGARPLLLSPDWRSEIRAIVPHIAVLKAGYLPTQTNAALKADAINYLLNY
jgi:hypothetical protein